MPKDAASQALLLAIILFAFYVAYFPVSATSRLPLFSTLAKSDEVAGKCRDQFVLLSNIGAERNSCAPFSVELAAKFVGNYRFGYRAECGEITGHRFQKIHRTALNNNVAVGAVTRQSHGNTPGGKRCKTLQAAGECGSLPTQRRVARLLAEPLIMPRHARAPPNLSRGW